jgi:hypothetical protein
MLLLPSAHAEEPKTHRKSSKSVEIQFDWDAVPGAQAYVIQVSGDSRFEQVLVESQVSDTSFPYRIPSPGEPLQFFFRVAAVGADGTRSEFSAPQSVEIRPEPKSLAEAPKPIPLPMPSPTPSPTPSPLALPPPMARSKPKPAPTKPATLARSTVTEEPSSVQAPRERSSFHAEIAYGALAQKRELKGTANPRTSSGTGLIPSRVRAELELLNEGSSAWIAGGSYLFETASPELAGALPAKLSVPVLQAWAGYGFRWDSLLVALGPYATSTNRILSAGLGFRSEAQLVFGAFASMGPHPDSVSGFQWKARLGAGAAGSTGADLSLSLRRSLTGFRSAKWSETRGLFLGAELQGRWMSLETAYAGALELGFRL